MIQADAYGISISTIHQELLDERGEAGEQARAHIGISTHRALESAMTASLDGFVTDSGLRPRYPAVEIYRVDGSGSGRALERRSNVFMTRPPDGKARTFCRAPSPEAFTCR